MIYSFFTDIFKYEKFPVEYECFNQLKNDTDLNYIAVPWTQILNSHWLRYPNWHPAEYYFRILSKEKITQQNNFTICQHDSYMSLKLYYKHLNITKVFSPLHDTASTIDGVEIIPISFTSSFDFESVKKDIFVSFVGTHTSHPIRERMKTRIYGDGIIYRDSYHIDTDTFDGKNKKEREEAEYKDILQRSRFSLCPRGSSPSSVRFWESLHAGAIPILISDNWCLPYWDWDNTIIKINERDFETMSYYNIIKLLNDIPLVREVTMRKNCLKAYNLFKKENFKQYILNKL
jgi:hypothetical protein